MSRLPVSPSRVGRRAATARARAVLMVTATAIVVAGCGVRETVRHETRTTAGPRVSTTIGAPSTTVGPIYRSQIADVRPDVGNVKVLDRPAGVPLQLDTTGTGPLKVVTIDNPLPSGAPTTFLVRTPNVPEAGGVWHEVYLPVRPNGSTGWISGADVTLVDTDLAATVELGAHRLVLRNADQVVATYDVAIGTPANPTPVGLYYVKELVTPTNGGGSYGPIAYGLSAFSPTLVDTEAFADGVIGIHGTNQPELIGQSVSHGCVRMRNEDILDLRNHQVPLGMPVTITG